MEKNKFYSVLVNAIIVKDGKILIARRSLKEEHAPGKWSIPGGKLENMENEENFDVLKATLIREIKEEVGIEINSNINLISDNIFKHSKGHMVLALVFLCEHKNGEAKALEDTIEVKWITAKQLHAQEYAPNVEEYLAKGFSLIPYLIRKQRKL